MGTGEHDLPGGAEELGLPPGVEVVRISPARIRVQLAKTLQPQGAGAAGAQGQLRPKATR